MRAARALITIAILSFLLVPDPALALDPSLDISQYAHTAWTVRDGFSLGNIFAMAQTPDGYLWLATEFGLFRFEAFAASLGNHLQVSNSRQKRHTACSSRAMALSGLARLPAS